MLLEALLAAPDAAAGVQFTSCQIPGLNGVDFAGLHRDARFTGLFLTPEMTDSYRMGESALHAACLQQHVPLSRGGAV